MLDRDENKNLSIHSIPNPSMGHWPVAKVSWILITSFSVLLAGENPTELLNTIGFGDIWDDGGGKGFRSRGRGGRGSSDGGGPPP